MQIHGKPYRTVWAEENQLYLIDQTRLPWEFKTVQIPDLATVVLAIKDMWVRGAGCIGATAGYGMWLAAREAATLRDLKASANLLKSTRPTAVNLAWAVDRVLKVLEPLPPENWEQRALEEAERIAEEDVNACAAIGNYGADLLEQMAVVKGEGVLNILTHCNAGWLAFVDHGSATAPIYEAHRRGVKIHVWVDETRPRNQGAKLTAWELEQEGVPHTLIADNVGGHLMQHGLVDLVITGADRVIRQGDVANKIGTYLKALAAKDNGIPFYVALPNSTMDWQIADGVEGIPIEQRGSEELRWLNGLDQAGVEREIAIFPETHATANFGFDVTPARLVSGLITEQGIFQASEESLGQLKSMILLE